VIAASAVGINLKTCGARRPWPDLRRGWLKAERICRLPRSALRLERDRAHQPHCDRDNGGELDGMARDHAMGGGRTAAAVHETECSRMQNRAASAWCLSSTGRAGRRWRRASDRERIKTPSPAPIGARNRIDRTHRPEPARQEFGGSGGGVGAERGPYSRPRLRRLLASRCAKAKEFGRACG